MNSAEIVILCLSTLGIVSLIVYVAGYRRGYRCGSASICSEDYHDSQTYHEMDDVDEDQYVADSTDANDDLSGK